MSPTGDNNPPTTFEDGADPATDYAFAAHIDRVEAEKQAARDAPDIPWGTWWYQSGSKWYVAVGFLILDVWIASAGYSFGLGALLFVPIIPALYAEFLLYRYLYYVPDIDEPVPAGRFRPTWIRPVRYGRWTEEGAAARAGRAVGATEAGPDPKEFL